MHIKPVGGRLDRVGWRSVCHTKEDFTCSEVSSGADFSLIVLAENLTILFGDLFSCY